MIAFADTSFFHALLNRRDKDHQAAREWVPKVRKIITTEWDLTELANTLSASTKRGFFKEYRLGLQSAEDCTIAPLDMELHEKGIGLFAARADKQWSLVDCISFLVMERENLREALTNDHHFEQAGFIALLK